VQDNHGKQIVAAVFDFSPPPLLASDIINIERLIASRDCIFQIIPFCRKAIQSVVHCNLINLVVFEKGNCRV